MGIRPHHTYTRTFLATKGGGDSDGHRRKPSNAACR
jgi:hypothetical protein